MKKLTVQRLREIDRHPNWDERIDHWRDGHDYYLTYYPTLGWQLYDDTTKEVIESTLPEDAGHHGMFVIRTDALAYLETGQGGKRVKE